MIFVSAEITLGGEESNLKGIKNEATLYSASEHLLYSIIINNKMAYGSLTSVITFIASSNSDYILINVITFGRAFENNLIIHGQQCLG